jgi:hypothetical protein
MEQMLQYNMWTTVNLNLEKIMLFLAVASFTATAVGTLAVAGNPLTREEAIERSQNTKIVRGFLETADQYFLEVHYLNKTHTEGDYGIWNVVWYIHPMGADSGFAYVVTHSISEGTGEILSEGTMSLR